MEGCGRPGGGAGNSGTSPTRTALQALPASPADSTARGRIDKACRSRYLSSRKLKR
jgi:hypothetical protein